MTKSVAVQTFLLIHNAGSLGPIDKQVNQFVDGSEIRRYFEFNFVSMILLNNEFLNLIGESTAEKIIVNMTSLLAIKGMSGFGLYSAGKSWNIHLGDRSYKF